MNYCDKQGESFICAATDDYRGIGQELDGGGTDCPFAKIETVTKEFAGNDEVFEVATCKYCYATKDENGEIISHCGAIDAHELTIKENFLRNHFSYYTGNSWSGTKSFAADVKVYNVLPQEYQDKAIELLYEGDLAVTFLNCHLEDYEERMNDKYPHIGVEVGANGRSQGYFVLYFNKLAMYDHLDRFIDDFIENEGNINELYDIVTEFDKMVQDVIQATIQVCDEYELVGEEIEYMKTVKVLKEKAA